MSTPPVRYLVAHDGGERGADALRLAVALGEGLGAGLDVVFVVRSDDPFGQPYPPVGDVTELVAEQARERLESAVAGSSPDLDVRTHLRTAPSVPEGLLDAADGLGSRAVVVGADGGANPFGVGPVARSLLHSSPVPVVLTAGDAARRGAPEPLRHLVAAVGTRPGAQAVLEQAVEAATRTRLPLHVVSLLPLDQRDGAEASALAELEAAVEGARSRLATGQVTVQLGRGRAMGDAVQSIGWPPGALLLLGSSRLARGRQTFLGPTAARVLRHVPVPVVVVPRGEA